MNNLQAKYIYSSALFVAQQPIILNTILGSCVAVCLWDRAKNTGGMNHYMLPLWNGVGLASPKYGNIANDLLVKKMLNNGSKTENLIAKFFGGARILDDTARVFDIGQHNVELAFDIYADYGIQIAKGSTGGTRGRKIFFNTQTGEVMQKYL
ncbi:MAG: chemotaxis protein CheD [Bacteroidales bacterium]|nr:chemotaxis protein CheD [Bacteroidales bacterium]